MSVLNVYFAPDAVHFLSDTMAYTPDHKPACLVHRKAHVSRSRRFIWSTRGSVSLGDRFDYAARDAASIDEAEAIAADWIQSLTADALSGRDVEVTIGGWSDRAGDLLVIQVARGKTDDVEVNVLPRGVTLLPNLPASYRIALPAEIRLDQFIRLAEVQQLHADRLEAGGFNRGCIGGVKHITTVDRASAHQRIAGLYSTYDQDAALPGGDPNADAVALFRGEHREVAR